MATSNGKEFSAQSQGKYKITETNHPTNLSALSAPYFAQNLIGAGHLAMKHDVLFPREGFYLLDPCAAHTQPHILGIRGQDSLYCTKEEKEKQSQSVSPAGSPAVKDPTLYNTFNHYSREKQSWFRKE